MPIPVLEPQTPRTRSASTLARVATNLYRRTTGAQSWWMFLYRSPVSSKRIEMSLGPTSLVNITQAKALTLKHRVALLEGRCPLRERQAEQAARRAQHAPKAPSCRKAFDLYLAAHEGAWRNPKHRQQWQNTIETYAYPILRDLPVSGITTAEAMQILEPIWRKKTETASRVRQRIESVLDFAAARNWCAPPNPARWKGHLAKLLPAPGKITTTRHHAAIPWQAMPALYQSLAGQQDATALALRYVCQTVLRTSEVLAATPAEIDHSTRTHIVPAARMKAGREHRVPLAAEALRVLVQAAAIRTGATIFCGARGGPLSDMALLLRLRRLYPGQRFTVHGLRSAFRDWCSELAVPGELAERQLAHAVADKTEAAYLRTDALDPRRVLMQRWSDFLTQPASAGADVADIAAARRARSSHPEGRASDRRGEGGG